jgi:hypothetical protein
VRARAQIASLRRRRRSPDPSTRAAETQPLQCKHDPERADLAMAAVAAFGETAQELKPAIVVAAAKQQRASD